MTKLLIVCMGNICRSPMAQAVAQKIAKNIGLAQLLLIDSAGTHARRAATPPDPRAHAALLGRGYALPGQGSRPIALDDFEKYDQILAMDATNLLTLKRLCPAHLEVKLRLFLSYAIEQSETEVPDPYYGNALGFERVLDLCELGASALIRHWEKLN